jgi:hypothetical protein
MVERVMLRIMGRGVPRSSTAAAGVVMALILLLAAVVLGATRSIPARAATGDFAPGVVNVSNTACNAEGEETVSANPLNARDILVGSNQWQPPDCANLGNQALGPSGATTCAIFDSHDGGQTWNGQRLGQTGIGTQPLPSVGPLPVVGGFPAEFSDPGNLIAADQNTVWDHHGVAYYQCLYLGLGNSEPQVWVFKSTDSGRTWGPKVVAFDELNTQIQIDRPFLTIDVSGGPRDGTLYLSWETMFYQAWIPQVYARSSVDGGQTWGPVHRVDEDTHEAQWDPRQYPQVGPDGALHVEYDASPLTTPCQCDTSNPLLVMATSNDGGVTFTHSVVDPAVHRIASNDEAFSYFQELIAAFATSPADPTRMAVAWPDSGTGEDRIVLRQSVDGGGTWGPRIDIADDPPGTSNQHDHVALTYLPDGRLVVAWRDRRFGGGTLASHWDLFVRLGTPAGSGLSLGPAVRMTATSQPPTTGAHGSMPSEYLAVSADASGIDAAWDQLDPAGVMTDNYFRHLSMASLPPDLPDLTAPAAAVCVAVAMFAAVRLRRRRRHS